MQVIPVLDLQNGIVVHGVAGQRDAYQPIRSVLTPSRDPSVVLREIHRVFGFPLTYIADLDGIQSRQVNRCVLAELSRLPGQLMVDAGVRSADDVESLLDPGIDQVVVALETLPSPDVAREIVARCPAESIWLSLDLNDGHPVSAFEGWQDRSPVAIANECFEIGFRNFIVLDVASVGTSGGLPTIDLCQRLRQQLDGIRIISGGGVSNVEQMMAASESGLDGLLVASAIHSGRLTPEDIPPEWNSAILLDRSC